jgi:hypothetical protein
MAYLAVWKGEKTPDEPKRLVWVCGEVKRATTTPWSMAVWKAKRTPARRAKEALDVWRGKAGDNDTTGRAVWKGKRTPDEPKRGSSGCMER